MYTHILPICWCLTRTLTLWHATHLQTSYMNPDIVTCLLTSYMYSDIVPCPLTWYSHGQYRLNDKRNHSHKHNTIYFTFPLLQHRSHFDPLMMQTLHSGAPATCSQVNNIDGQLDQQWTTSINGEVSTLASTAVAGVDVWQHVATTCKAGKQCWISDHCDWSFTHHCYGVTVTAIWCHCHTDTVS